MCIPQIIHNLFYAHFALLLVHLLDFDRVVVITLKVSNIQYTPIKTNI